MMISHTGSVKPIGSVAVALWSMSTETRTTVPSPAAGIHRVGHPTDAAPKPWTESSAELAARASLGCPHDHESLVGGQQSQTPPRVGKAQAGVWLPFKLRSYAKRSFILIASLPPSGHGRSRQAKQDRKSTRLNSSHANISY